MDKNKAFIGVVAVLIVLAMTNQPQLKQASAGLGADRTFSKTTVSPGESITATYTPESLNYFAIIEPVPNGWSVSRTVSPDGKVRTTADGSAITLTWTAPTTEGTYSFTGEYFVYPDTAYSNFAEDVVIVGSPPACTCTSWVNSGCGGGSCGDTYMYQMRSCTPADCNIEGQCVTDSSCTASQPWYCVVGDECITSTFQIMNAYCYTTASACQAFLDDSCTDTTWNPSPSTVCSGQSFTQTSNCDNTKTATGTKDCSVPCTDTVWTPALSESCTSVLVTQTLCGATRQLYGTKDCTTPTPTPQPTTCEAQLGCELWEECSDDGTACDIAGWVIIAGVVMGFFFLMNMMPRR